MHTALLIKKTMKHKDDYYSVNRNKSDWDFKTGMNRISDDLIVMHPKCHTFSTAIFSHKKIIYE